MANNSGNNRHKIIFGFIFLVLVALVIIYWQPLQAFAQSAYYWIDNLGPWGPGFFLILVVLTSGILIPAIPLRILAGALFGFWIGFIVVSIGSTISCGLKFLLARYFFRDSVMKKIKANPRLQQIDEAIEKEGFKVLLLLRNVPVVSSLFLNYICGVTKMSLKDFLLASFLGRIPQQVLFVYLGYFLGVAATAEQDTPLHSNIKVILLVLGLAATIGVSFYVWKISKNILSKEIPPEEPASAP